MKTTHRRYWVFFLLFLFNAIAYVDRVNMSVAGKPIAHELAVAGRARLSVLVVSVGLCADDAARRAADRPLGHAYRRHGGHRGVVGGADADRRRRQFCDDAGDAARSRCRRGAVRAGHLWQRPVVVALYRARHRDRRDLGRFEPRSGAWRAGCRVADRDMSWRWSFVITGAVGFVWVRCGLAGLDAGKDAMASGSRAAAYPRRARRRRRRRRAMAASAISG